MSKVQDEILELLRNGWRLHHSYHTEPGEVLCRPSEDQSSRPIVVSLRTFDSMMRKGLLTFDGKVSEKCSRYRSA